MKDLDSCRRITQLIEKQNFKESTLTENLEIGFHLIHCRTGCKVYYKQSKLINSLLIGTLKSATYLKVENISDNDNVGNEQFKESLKEKIKKIIE